MVVEIVSRAGKKISPKKIKKQARRILEILERDRAELSLVLLRNREMQDLNARYRKKNQPTDVLSFPAGKGPLSGERVLGDVVISVEQAEKQAREKDKTLEKELEVLLIHGILHLLGYDHERSKKEAARMRAMERRLQRALCQEGR